VIAHAKMLGELSGMNEWFMASLGSCATSLALPASPMAQPGAVIAGNSVSGLIGITVAILIKDP
jgi:CBS domain-containing membrane protein